ncbi:MAG TPA: hypothetical protein VHS78_10460 [Candidatus Elarobacter sp.]|jgi:hypothetical protein|nr:hypothetical protein [Candidatus Elarobacter sp.]
MSEHGLSALRVRVCDDPLLALRLRELEPATFDAEVLRIAEQLGYDVTHDDLRAAAAEAQQRWQLRWTL